ncbi:MAG TPA: hypothetical protein VD948_05120 [Rhodothermales bacterium]|nr:hypothetical protein [Rhodothermales bacterium]
MSYRVHNSAGLQVFALTAPTEERATAELRHYLLQYADEAPLTIERKSGSRWRAFGRFTVEVTATPAPAATEGGEG